MAGGRAALWGVVVAAGLAAAALAPSVEVQGGDVVVRTYGTLKVRHPQPAAHNAWERLRK